MSAIKKIIKINKKEPKTPLEVMVKIQEECGELAAEVLRFIGKKGANGNPKSVIKQNILQEGCDIIITTTSILQKMGFKEKDINKMIDIKCEKWKYNLTKYKEWKKNR